MTFDYWGIEHDADNHAAYSKAMLWSAYFFYGEFALKLLALGVDGYFYDGWNRFDFFLVAASTLEVVLGYLPDTIAPPLGFTRVLRLLRALHARTARNYCAHYA